ncbi:MAG: AmmeMemoRadiSam system protein A [Chromatiales bacterium]
MVGYGAYVLYEDGRREFTDDERRQLLQTARESIAHGLQTGGPLHVDLQQLPASLREQRATFVTLQAGGQLRGCIGTLEPYRPLAIDVAENAYGSAFRDPRFPALCSEELASLDVHISVLGRPVPIAFSDETALIAQLRPGIDGVILRLGDRQATFLPSVWETLGEPSGFLHALKQKAGIPVSDDVRGLRAWRYVTESFSDHAATIKRTFFFG